MELRCRGIEPRDQLGTGRSTRRTPYLLLPAYFLLSTRAVPLMTALVSKRIAAESVWHDRERRFVRPGTRIDVSLLVNAFTNPLWSNRLRAAITYSLVADDRDPAAEQLDDSRPAVFQFEIDHSRVQRTLVAGRLYVQRLTRCDRINAIQFL